MAVPGLFGQASTLCLNIRAIVNQSSYMPEKPVKTPCQRTHCRDGGAFLCGRAKYGNRAATASFIPLVIAGGEARLVFSCHTVALPETELPWATSDTLSFTRSQPLRLNDKWRSLRKV